MLAVGYYLVVVIAANNGSVVRTHVKVIFAVTADHKSTRTPTLNGVITATAIHCNVAAIGKRNQLIIS